ncbi:RHS repeat domain-containing protein [Pseudomonas sp. NPDC090592]|uniref:RHS repeat domain-containing protein n=1 Tax=Pseudomonas sp. NPDC090592 TaxID=3364480 RepID=UPI00383A5FDE
MSNERSVHSNAFNFMSHLTGGVDSRTGLYTFSANLRSLSGNDQLGPEFDVALHYSPLNVFDSGYGKGWNLRTTEFDPAMGRRIISLANGETFKADGSVGTTNQLTMSEKKIDTFHLYEDSDSQWRVVHRSGVVEVLEPKGSGQYTRAVPTLIFSRQGHWLNLEYDTFGNFPMLTKITDMRGVTLLEVARQGNVQLTMPTDTGNATYTLVLGRDNQVDRIELPTENLASWRFTYKRERDCDCIHTVHTPAGGFEEITYGDGGHEFPIGSGLQPLPRVTRHVQHPGHCQPAIDTRYTYSSDGHNFLGGNIELDWINDGLDNLFRQVVDYDYATTETLWADGKPVRSTFREFNKFHLLTGETTYVGEALNAGETEVIGNQIKEVKTGYNLKPGLFKEQPNYCQLVHSIDTRWWLKNNPGTVFKLSETSTYDDYGNLKTHKAANGIEDAYTWYDATEPGFPGHEEGFVAFLKEKIQTPAANHPGSKLARTTHYTYQQLPTLTSAQSQTQQPHWLEVEVETYTSGDVTKATNHAYEQAADETVVPAKPLQHGRLKSQQTRYPNPNKGKPGEADTLDTLLEHTYTYETLFWDTAKARGPLVNGTMQVLQDEQLLTGYDASTKEIKVQLSLATGKTVLNRDDTNTEIMTVWDALQRVEREIVSPGKEEEALRRYEYLLSNDESVQATQTQYDAKGVMTVAYFDGASRTVKEEREDPDNDLPKGETKTIFTASFDAWGRPLEETEVDWLKDRDLHLKSQYRYDSWGEQLCVIGPDGVAEFAQTNPVGDGETGPVRREWRQRVLDDAGNELENGAKTGVTETQLNRFDLPVHVKRWVKKDPADEQETLLKSEVLSEYDGYGRKHKEMSGLGNEDEKQKETFTYDGFDRLLAHELREGDVVYRTYAAHSDKDLPVTIRVNDLELLGEQHFNGLDLMDWSITGGRRQVYEYAPGETKPNKVITPEGEIEYLYRPYLTDEPVMRRLGGNEANYVFDKQNARLESCNEVGGQAFTRTYYSTGEVRDETRGEYDMAYGYSYRGRLESYRDVLKQTQVNEYDDIGRLEVTTLGELSSTFVYDDLGRTKSYETTEASSAGINSLKTSLEYDDLEREISRTFTFTQSPDQVLTQEYDEFDRIIERKLAQGPTVLRTETYKYDTRGRLTIYTCVGELCPVDPYGKQISRQVFRFDPVDNIRLVQTTFEGGQNLATYHFENLADPAQLSRITNNFGDPYPEEIQLEYDRNGNLIRDDAGRSLEYDALNRLTKVTDPEKGECLYGYDPQNILSSTESEA